MELNGKKILRCLEAYRNSKVEAKEFPKLEPFLCELPTRLLQNSPYWKPLKKSSNILLPKSRDEIDTNESIFFSILSTTLMLDIAHAKIIWNQELNSYFSPTLVSEQEYTLETFPQILSLYFTSRNAEWTLLKEIMSSRSQAYYEPIQKKFTSMKLMENLLEHLQKLGDFQTQEYDSALLSKLSILKPKTNNLFNTAIAINESYFQQFQQKVMFQWNTAVLDEVQTVLQLFISISYVSGENVQWLSGSQYLEIFELVSSNAKFPLCQHCFSILSSTAEEASAGDSISKIWKLMDNINNLLFLFGVQALSLRDLLYNDFSCESPNKNSTFAKSITVNTGENIIRLLSMKEQQDGILNRTTSCILLQFWYYFLQQMKIGVARLEMEKWEKISSAIYYIDDKHIVSMFQQKLLSLQAIYPRDFFSSGFKSESLVCMSIDDELREDFTTLVFQLLGESFHFMLQFRFFPTDSAINNSNIIDGSKFRIGTPENVSSAKSTTNYSAVPLIENQIDLPVALQIISTLYSGNDSLIESLAEVFLEKGTSHAAHPMKQLFLYLITYTSHSPDLLLQFLVAITKVSQHKTRHEEEIYQLYEYVYNTLQNSVVCVQTKSMGAALVLDQPVTTSNFSDGKLIGKIDSNLSISRNQEKKQYLSPSGKDGRLELQDLHTSSEIEAPNELASYCSNFATFRIGSIVRYNSHASSSHLLLDRKKMTYLAFSNGYQQVDELIGVVVDIATASDNESEGEYLVRWQDMSISWWNLLALEYLDCYLRFNSQPLSETADTKCILSKCLVDAYPVLKLFTSFLIQLQCNHMKMHLNFPYLFSTTLLGGILSAYFCVDFSLTYDHYNRMIESEIYPSVFAMYSPDDCLRVLKCSIGITEAQSLHKIMKSIFYNFSAQYEWFDSSTPSRGVIGSKAIYHPIQSNQLLRFQIGSNLNDSANEVVYLLSWYELLTKVIVSVLLYDLHTVWSQASAVNVSTSFNSLCCYVNTLELISLSMQQADFNLNHLLILELYYSLQSLKEMRSSSSSWCDVWRILSLDRRFESEAIYGQIDVQLVQIGHFMISKYALSTNANFFNAFQQHLLSVTNSVKDEDSIQANFEQIEKKFRYYQQSFKILLESTSITLDLMDFYFESLIRLHSSIVSTKPQTLSIVCKKDRLKMLLNVLQFFQDDILPHTASSLFDTISNVSTAKKCTLTDPANLSQFSYILFQYLTMLPSYLLALAINNQRDTAVTRCVGKQKKMNWEDILSGSNGASSKVCSPEVNSLLIDVEAFIHLHDEHLVTSITGLSNGELLDIFTLSNTCAGLLVQLFSHPLYIHHEKNILIIQEILNRLLVLPLLPVGPVSLTSSQSGVVGENNSLLPFFFNQSMSELISTSVLGTASAAIQSLDQYHYVLAVSSYSTMSFSSYPYRSLLRSLRTRCRNLLSMSFAFATNVEVKNQSTTQATTSCQWFNTIPVTSFISWFQSFSDMVIKPLQPNMYSKIGDLSEEILSGWKVILNLSKHHPHIFSLLIGYNLSFDSNKRNQSGHKGSAPHLDAYSPLTTSPLIKFYLNVLLPQIEEFYCSSSNFLALALEVLAQIFFQAKRYPIFRAIVNTILSKSGIGGKFWDYLLKPLILDPPMLPDIVSNLDNKLDDFMPIIPPNNEAVVMLEVDDKDDERVENRQNINLNEVFDLPMTSSEYNTQNCFPNISECEWNMLLSYFPIISMPIESCEDSQSNSMLNLKRSFYLRKLISDKEHFLEQLQCLKIILQFLSWERYGSLYELGDVICAQHSSKYLLQNFYTNPTTKAKFQHTIYRYFCIMSATPLTAGLNLVNFAASSELEGNLKSFCSIFGITLKDIIHNSSQSGSQSNIVPFIPLYKLFQAMILECVYFSYLPFNCSASLSSSTVQTATVRNFLTTASLVPFHVYHTFCIREIQAAEISFFSQWKVFLQLFVLPGSPLRQHYLPTLPPTSSSVNNLTGSVVGSESPVLSLGAMSPITNQPDASPMTAKESTFQGDKRSYEVITKLLDSLIPTDAVKTPGKTMSKDDEEELFEMFALNNTDESCLVHTTYDFVHLYEKLRLLLSMFHHQLQEVFYKDMLPEDSLVAPRDRDQSRLSYDKLKKSLIKLAVIYSIYFPSKKESVTSDKELDEYLSFLYPSVSLLHSDYNCDYNSTGSYFSGQGTDGKLGILSLLHPRFLISCENQISYSIQFKIQIEFFSLFSLLITTLAGYDSDLGGMNLVVRSKVLVYNIAQKSFSKILSIFGMDSLLTVADKNEGKSNQKGWEITLKEIQILMKLSCQLMKLTYHTVGVSQNPRKNSLTYNDVKSFQNDAVSDWTVYVGILSSLYNAPIAENLPKLLTNFRSSVKNLFACSQSESCVGHNGGSYQNISTGTKTLTTSGPISHTSMHHITMTTKTTTSTNVVLNQQPWTSLDIDGDFDKSLHMDHEDYNAYLYYMLQMNDLLLQYLQSCNIGLKNKISVPELLEILKLVNSSRLFACFQEALVSQSNPVTLVTDNMSIEARLENNSSFNAQPMNVAIMSILMGYSAVTGDESLLSIIWQRTLVLLESVFIILNRVSTDDGCAMSSNNQEDLIHQLRQFHMQYEDLLLFPFTSFISANLENKSNFPYRYSSQQIQLVQRTYHYLHSLERYLPNARTYFPKLYATAKVASGFYLSHWIPLLLQYQEITNWQSTMTPSPIASQVLFSHLIIVSPSEKKYCHPSTTHIHHVTSATSGISNKSSPSISAKSMVGDNLHVRFGENEVFTLPSVNPSTTSHSSSSVTDAFTSPSGKTMGTSFSSTPTSILKSTKKPGATFGVSVSSSNKVSSGSSTSLSVKESFPGSCFLQRVEHMLIDAVHVIIVFIKSFLVSPDDYLPLATANVSGIQSAADYPIGCTVYYLTPLTSDPITQKISMEAASKEITTTDLVRGWEVQEGIVKSVHKHDKKAQKLTTFLGGNTFPPVNFNNTFAKAKAGEMRKQELLPDSGDNDYEVYLDILHANGTMDRNTPSHYVVYLLPPLIPFISTRHLIHQYTSHLQQLPHYHPHVKPAVHPSPRLFDAGEYTITNPMLTKVNGLTDSNILPAISTGHLVLLMHYLYSSDTYNRLTGTLPRIPLRGGAIGASPTEIHQRPEVLKIFMMECWIVIMSCLQHHSYAPLGQEQVMIKQLNELAELLSMEPTPSGSQQSSLWNSGNIAYAKDDQNWLEMAKKLQDVWQETYYRLYSLISPTAPVVEAIFTRTKTPRKSRFGLREKVGWVHTHEDI